MWFQGLGVQVPSLTPVIRQYALVAQLDRATDFGSVGRGFESCRARQEIIKCGLLAQLVEQLTLNQRVVGSSPSQSSKRIHDVSSETSFFVGFQAY